MKRWILAIALAVIAVGLTLYAVFFTVNGVSAPSQKNKNQNQSKIEGHEQHDTSTFNVFDTDFAQKMVVLSQQATEISTVAELQAQNSNIKVIASKLSREQSSAATSYIELLTGMKQDYQNLSDFPQTDGHDMYPSYPGIATMLELTRYRERQGAEVDKEYLRLMVRHYEETLDTINSSSRKIQYEKTIKLQAATKKSYEANLKELKALQASLK